MHKTNSRKLRSFSSWCALWTVCAWFGAGQTHAQTTPGDHAYFGSALATGDFNDDGIQDVAVGADRHEVDGKSQAGVVDVYYGGPFFPFVVQVLTQDIFEQAEETDWFGHSLAVGDFDGDGDDDLAIGAPGETVGGASQTGMVHIIYQHDGGLSTRNTDTFDQDSSQIPGINESGDNWGGDLAAGDFDGNGIGDLAVGAWGEDIGSTTQAGAVTVLYGTSVGLRGSGSQSWHQNSPGIEGAAQARDYFGASLAVGDFDDNGRDDLAIGVPNEDVDGKDNAGSVTILYGTPLGLAADDSQGWHQGVSGVAGALEDADQFGFAVASGYFNDDRFADLAVGVPGEAIGNIWRAGLVHIFYGGDGGLSASGDHHITQGDIAGVTVEPDDTFGYSLAVADFGSDGLDDLVVGSPGEAIEDIGGAGMAVVLFGGDTRLSATDAQVFHQDTPGVASTAFTNERFGAKVAAANVGGDAFPDLIVAAPQQNVGTFVWAGAVHVLWGTSSGVTTANDLFITE